jgi:glyoxylase-like metal-dependent hydrolase (beta-lactamase superfamily II)
MKIIAFEGGYDKNLSYLIWCNSTKIASIIDPSVRIDDMLTEIKNNNLKLNSIFITHSHQDHIAYLNDFIKLYPNIIIYINNNSELNLPEIMRIENNQKIKVGNSIITCLSTPGHFYDSMCFWNQKSKILFTGDTIFVGRTGRVVSQRSNIEDLYNSIYNIILKLPLDTTIYPGHNYGLKNKISIQNNITISNFFKSKNLQEFINTMENFEKTRIKT